MRLFGHIAEAAFVFDQLALNAAAFEAHFAAGGFEQLVTMLTVVLLPDPFGPR